jgi:hypothetical protein
VPALVILVPKREALLSGRGYMMVAVVAVVVMMVMMVAMIWCAVVVCVC